MISIINIQWSISGITLKMSSKKSIFSKSKTLLSELW